MIGREGAVMTRRRDRRSFNLDAIRARLDEAATELAVMADETQGGRERRAKPRSTRATKRTVRSYVVDRSIDIVV